MTRAQPRDVRYQAVVVGAGPYGLSTAAHLRWHGIDGAVFGKTLELWRDHMPDGMLLRSHRWATNLSDPDRRYRLERFLKETNQSNRYPLPRQAFIDYGRWFQERAVPDLDETYVASVRREDDHFLLTLDDGRQVRSAAVVMATGLQAYANRPAQFADLPATLVSHSCDHRNFSSFRGKQVVIVGGGQSAIEYAALLHEAGAAVRVISRRPIVWLAPDPGDKRSLLAQVRAPDANIAPGWKNWILDRAPYAFYRFPQDRKDRANRNYYTSAASDWLRTRVIGKVALHEGQTITRIDPTGGKADVAISDGTHISADHIILATGYRVDLNRLRILHPSLRAAIDTDMAIPLLSPRFESSVPGLYFVGLTSLRAFGPLYRFVAGCEATARRVAGSIARNARAAARPRLASLRRDSYART